MKTFNELRSGKSSRKKTFKDVVSQLTEGFISETSDYTDPTTFENVPGIDISLTDLRKKLLITVGESKIELTKEQAEEIMDGLDAAIRRMS